MPATNTAAAAAAARKPIFAGNDVSRQAQDFLAAGSAWLTTHWLQIMIATAIAVVLVFALHGLRKLGERLCARHPDSTGWAAVIGRAIVRTNNFFIVMLAAKLVGDTFAAAAPPQEVAGQIS